MEKITQHHPMSKSADTVQQNIELLKDLFPTIVKEGKIDIEELKALLGDDVESNEEYYRFTWAGKSMARKEVNKPSTATLRPNKLDSKDWDTTNNIFIEGDNLEVLKLLQKGYANRIKAVYIDPPYNTGHDFVYKDDYSDNLTNYLSITGQLDDSGKRKSSNSESDGRFHSNWLNMIYPRLKLARNLLTDDGVIFISIDDNEIINLRKVCDEIFGEENFIGNLVIQTATDNNATQINTEHEYMICFAKNKKNQNYWFGKNLPALKIQEKYNSLKNEFQTDLLKIQTELRAWIKNNKEKLPRVTHYDNVDEKGVYHDGDIANTRHGGYEYEVIHPITLKACKVPEKGFRYPKTTLESMIANNDLLFGGKTSQIDHPIPVQIDHQFRSKLTTTFQFKLTT